MQLMKEINYSQEFIQTFKKRVAEFKQKDLTKSLTSEFS